MGAIFLRGGRVGPGGGSLKRHAEDTVQGAAWKGSGTEVCELFKGSEVRELVGGARKQGRATTIGGTKL